MHRITLSFLVLALASSLVACSSVVVDDPDTFSGTVDNTWGDPVSGVRVQVGESITTTDDAGGFEVPATVGPRDVALVLPDTSAAYVYVGLTDQDQSFRLPVNAVNPTADDHATVLTVKFPEKNSASLRAMFVVDFIDSVTRSSLLAGDPLFSDALEYPTDARWRGAHSVKARVQAFHVEMDPAVTVVLHYVGYDSAEVTLTDGVPASVAVSWKPPPFAAAKVSVTPKLGSPPLTIYDAEVGIRLPGAARAWRLGFGSIMTGSELSSLVPDLAAVTFEVSVGAADGAGTSTATIPGLAAGAKGPIVGFEPAPLLVSPPDGGAVGIGTKLEWSPRGDGAVWVGFAPVEQKTGGIRYLMATAGDSVVIPDLSRLGVTLPQGLKYGWSVWRDSQTPTVEAIAAKSTSISSSTEPAAHAASAFWTITSQ